MLTKNTLRVLIACSLMICLPMFANAQDTTAPHVVASIPATGAINVPPTLTEISVTFSEPMMDKSWSWVYESKETFPTKTGEPFFKDNGTTCVLPVKLAPGKTYTIWINSSRFTYFQDPSHNSARPYKIVFSTSK